VERIGWEKVVRVVLKGEKVERKRGQAEKARKRERKEAREC